MNKPSVLVIDGANFYAALMYRSTLDHRFKNKSDIAASFNYTNVLMNDMLPTNAKIHIVMKKIPDRNIWNYFNLLFRDILLKNQSLHYTLNVPINNNDRQCDDYLAVQLGIKNNATIITNDNYRWLKHTSRLVTNYTEIDAKGANNLILIDASIDRTKMNFLRFKFDVISDTWVTNWFTY